MNTRMIVLGITCVTALALAGCGAGQHALDPQPGPTSAQEESAMTEELARHPELSDETLTESEARVDAGNTTAAAIDPLFFWRRIDRVRRSFEFTFSDTDSTGHPTTALVVSHKRLEGWFNVLTGTLGPTGPTEGDIVRKPLVDRWVRRILLKRVDEASGRRPWRIAAVSSVRITSRDAETRIQSLRIQSGDLDTTVTDPLALWRLRRVLRFAPGAEVALTATTLKSDDVVVLYARDRRSRFESNGDGTFTKTWTAAELSGVHHFGVDALSHGTLFDDQAPYDSQAWILPYHTDGEELADLAP